MTRPYKILPRTILIAIALVLLSATYRYEVPPVAAVQLLKQNVFYIGVDNPVSIAIPGVAPSDVEVELQGGTIVSSDHVGQYKATVTAGTRATLYVYFVKDSIRHSAGAFDYRIKKIPDPVTYVNSIREDGVILKENLQTVTGIFTRMENFDFDCRFTPQSFSMSVIEEGEWKEYKATGPELTPEMKTALTRCEEEDKIIFHNVMTKGPAGDVRHVNSVTITVK